MLESFANLLTEVLKWVRPLFNRSGERLKRTVLAYHEMTRILNLTTAQRVVVVLVHNGGKNIRVDTKKFGSVILEDWRTPLTSIFSDTQDVPLDKDTIIILSRVYTEGMVKIRTEDLPSTSVLKPMYMRDGVKYAELHYLKDTKDDFTILSVVTTNEIDNFGDAVSRTTIDAGVRKIRKQL